jgi:hypothetical protein
MEFHHHSTKIYCLSPSLGAINLGNSFFPGGFMKKVFLCVVLIISITAIGFSDDETQGFKFDIWFSMGPSFGNYFMNGTNLESNYTGSPGFDLSFYALFGKRNIGLFFNYGILFPVITNTGKNLEPSVQLDFILLGVGFGHNFNEALKFYFGVGPNMNSLFLHSKENAETIGDYFIGLGLGGDIGLKFKVANYFNIDVGTTLSYSFAAYREIRNFVDKRRNKYETEYSGWEKGYSMISIKPYILFGVNVTR